MCIDGHVLYLLTGSDEANGSQRESLALKDHDTVGLAVVVQQRHAGTDKHKTNVFNNASAQFTSTESQWILNQASMRIKIGTKVLGESLVALDKHLLNYKSKGHCTLPPKLSSVIKQFRSGSIFCVFPSVACILIGKDGEYKKTHVKISDSVYKDLKCIYFTRSLFLVHVKQRALPMIC